MHTRGIHTREAGTLPHLHRPRTRGRSRARARLLLAAFLAASPRPWASVRADHGEDRASIAFVGALQNVAGHNDAQAWAALRVFADRREPVMRLCLCACGRARTHTRVCFPATLPSFPPAQLPSDLGGAAVQLPYLPEFVLGTGRGPKVVAHVGCGQATVHPFFIGADWREIRIDISPGNRPGQLPPRTICACS